MHEHLSSLFFFQFSFLQKTKNPSKFQFDRETMDDNFLRRIGNYWWIFSAISHFHTDFFVQSKYKPHHSI